MTDEELVPITLVPVEVFGGDCDCHVEAGHAYEQPEGTPEGMTAQEQPSGVIKLVPTCHGWGYGLSDAVSSWSDCNRADGKIYRVDDTDPQYRQPGETITVYVPRSMLPWFEKHWGDGAQERADRDAAQERHLAELRLQPEVGP